METQSLLNVVFALFCILGGAVLKSFYDAISRLRDSDDNIHARINDFPNMYMRRDDFIAFGERIEATLIRIEMKLDSKVDK